MRADKGSIFYVYVLFRPDTGQPFYVGKGHGRRMDCHSQTTRLTKDNPHKSSIIRAALRAGLDIPRVKVCEGLDEKTAFQYECDWIAALGCEPSGPLVNMTFGGEGTSVISEERRKAHGIMMKALWNDPEKRARYMKNLFDQSTISEERRKAWNEAISIGKTGSKRGPHSPEHCAKISAALKGKPHSKEHNAKVSAAVKGRTWSQEKRQQISSALKGRKLSPEHRAACKAGQARRRALKAVASSIKQGSDNVVSQDKGLS